MQKILIWGITRQSYLAFNALHESNDIIGFYDNDTNKHGCCYLGLRVFSLDEIIERKGEYEVVIAVPGFAASIEKQCHSLGIKVKGVYNGSLEKYAPLHFEDLMQREVINLYAGDVPNNGYYEDKIGLSIVRADNRHIYHNIMEPYPLPDDFIDTYTAEDVLEHIPYDKLKDVINEIYRVLKPGGLFRLALPDYRNDMMDMRCLKDKEGNILFDPVGGGGYRNAEVVRGGAFVVP